MTQIALPLQTSIRNDDADEDIAFNILNQDNLPMTVLGERIFKPFGSENQKRKPNGIVYPTRRIDLSNQQVNQQKHLARSNGHLEVPSKVWTNGKLSSSHGNLNQIAKNRSPDDFTKNLDAKLRKLQTEKKKFDSKKPFITTVKKGRFLDAPAISPPSKTFETIDEEESGKRNRNAKKQLYAYDSKPMVLSRSPPQNVHRSRCEAAAIAAGLTYVKEIREEDVTDSQKQRKKREAILPEPVLPEKRIFKERENNANQIQQKSDTEDDQARKTRAEMARRRAIARKRARMQSSQKPQPFESALQPARSPELKTVEIQTENYLQASLVKPPITDMDTQTEVELLKGMKDKLDGPLTKNQDEETQITPGDLFDFEEEVQPVLEILVGKTIESALIEILEEEELAALKEQQRRFLEMRAEEQREVGEQIEKHFVDQMMKKNSRSASELLENHLAYMIPPVIEELKEEGFLMEKESIKNGSFMPWLIEEVTMELADILSSGDVLIGMVRDILNRRKEICSAMYASEENEEEIKEIKEGVDKT